MNKFLFAADMRLAPLPVDGAGQDLRAAAQAATARVRALRSGHAPLEQILEAQRHEAAALAAAAEEARP